MVQWIKKETFKALPFNSSKDLNVVQNGTCEIWWMAMKLTEKQQQQSRIERSKNQTKFLCRMCTSTSTYVHAVVNEDTECTIQRVISVTLFHLSFWTTRNKKLQLNQCQSWIFQPLLFFTSHNKWINKIIGNVIQC